MRDILDLFAGTGANPRAYSVMDQDKLNHVLTAKPHERRVFIEEAAGIARYKQQRNETQGKLEAHRQNLVRVRDVMDEVKRQLNSLERQAKKAQQYKALQNEKRELALAIAAADHAALVDGGGAPRRGHDAAAGQRAGAARARRRAWPPARGSARGDPGERSSARPISGRRCRRSRASSSGCSSAASRSASRSASSPTRSTRLDRRILAAGERITRVGGEREQRRERVWRTRERLVAERAAAAHVARGRGRATSHGPRGASAIALEALRLEQVRLAAERTDLMREAGELRERHAQLARRAERLGQRAGGSGGRGRRGSPRSARRSRRPAMPGRLSSRCSPMSARGSTRCSSI